MGSLLSRCLPAILAPVLAGCEGALSTLDPAGPAARSIAGLWWAMLAGSGAILALVLGLLAAPFLRPRVDAVAEEARERVWIVRLGLVFPLAVLAALLGAGLLVGERLLPRGEALAVEAEARRWAWRFSYESMPGRATEGVLHIPAGQPVDVAVTTADVIHSFWVPRLAGKLDAIPGHVNVLRIEADAPGRYEGRSAEYSGPGYAAHRFEVIAHDAAGWAAFLAEETR